MIQFLGSNMQRLIKIFLFVNMLTCAIGGVYAMEHEEKHESSLIKSQDGSMHLKNLTAHLNKLSDENFKWTMDARLGNGTFQKLTPFVYPGKKNSIYAAGYYIAHGKIPTQEQCPELTPEQLNESYWENLEYERKQYLKWHF
jgi:hypothetical protein